MRNVLINKAEIESCWKTDDACFIKTKSGKLWICNLYFYTETGYNTRQSTYRWVSSAKFNEFVEVTLKGKCE